MRDTHELAGWLNIELRDARGEVVLRRRHKNLITDAGRAALARCFVGGATLNGLLIGVGESDKAAEVADTALRTPTERGKAEGATSAPASLVAITTIFDMLPSPEEGEPDSVQVLKEAGLFLEIGGEEEEPTLYSRVTFAPVHRSPNLALTLTWEVKF